MSRQWVISFPKRLRYFLHRDMALTGRVLRVWLRVVEARLRACSPGAPAEARFGAVSFIQRFGSSLNAHTHIHVCAIDGVFSQDPDATLRFHRVIFCSFSFENLTSEDFTYQFPIPVQPSGSSSVTCAN